jgi:uncharacterized protein
MASHRHATWRKPFEGHLAADSVPSMSGAQAKPERSGRAHARRGASARDFFESVFEKLIGMVRQTARKIAAMSAAHAASLLSGLRLRAILTGTMASHRRATWRKPLERHLAADSFPSMSGAQAKPKRSGRAHARRGAGARDFLESVFETAIGMVRQTARKIAATRAAGVAGLVSGLRLRAILTGIAVAVFCVYAGMAAVLFFEQRSLMYFPETIHTSPAQAGLPEAQEATLTTADGEHIVSWQVAPRHGKPVILYFHGNGGALRYRVQRFRNLIADGIGLVAIEYRGYGGSSGSPSESGLIKDAEAAYAFAAGLYPPQQLVLWGESLGSGVAVALAAEKPVGRVILEAPFTSAVALAAMRYWYVPVRLLMKDQFRSDERIGKVTAPVLILHGLRDRVVPFTMGEKLFELTQAPKHIVRFLDGGHEDLDRNGALHAVGRFLAGDLDHPPIAPKISGAALSQ